MEKCDTLETIDELHDSILALCQEDDENHIGDCTFTLTENVNGITDLENVCSTPGPNLESKALKEKEGSSFFHLSPSKMSGIQLPVIENKRLSCLQTPLSLAGLSPIVSLSSTPRLRNKSSKLTPSLKRKVRHFSSTPCVGPYQPKRLALNESEQTMMTISEIGDQSFENFCISNKSQVSKIKIDNLYNKEPLKEAVDIHDENYFKDALNAESIETARFSLVNYSKTDETIVAEDDNADLTADILGLEQYIVLDAVSQDEDDSELDLTVSDNDDTIISCKNSTIIEESKELGSTTVFGAETIPVKSSILLNEETIAVNSTLDGNFTPSLKRKLEDDIIDIKPFLVASENANSKRLKSVSDDIDGLIVPKTSTSPSESDSVVEVIYVEESIEVIDISDDSVAGDITITAKTSDLRDAKQTPVFSPLVATAPSVSLPQPSVSRPEPSVSQPQPSVSRPQPSVSRPQPSVILPQPSVSRPQPSVSPNQPPYTLNETELMKLVKSNWGTDPVHDVNNNLTTCSYRNKQTPIVHTSILEGNFRIPPLLRSVINKNDLQIKGKGKTPSEIAKSINKQLTNMDNDCHNKILYIEANKKIRGDELKHFHKGQIQMLRMRQIAEMRDASIRLQMDPMNYWSQCHKLQLYTDHSNQKDALQYQHNIEMRDLLNEIKGEKHILYEQAMKSKNNLTEIKEKLEAATNQNPVDPDMVHTTIDLYKGPCKSNGQKQSLVQVCLPADIASYMIREEEMYNMNYRYKK